MTLIATMLTACATVRHVDAQLYGPPPEELQENITVYVSFDGVQSVSSQCAKSIFGALGSMIPMHGCVLAEAGKPVRMIIASSAELTGQTHLVEFTTRASVKQRCSSTKSSAKSQEIVPSGGCFYKAYAEATPRLLWSNPCEIGNAYLCHEIGHANQFKRGWQQASISPLQHWGRSPDGETDPTVLMASASEPSEASSATGLPAAP